MILVKGALTPSLHSSLYCLTFEEPSLFSKSLPQVRVMVLELLLINLGIFIFAGKFYSDKSILTTLEGSVHPFLV